jgi:low temperature requirement protein LtrA
MENKLFNHWAFKLFVIINSTMVLYILIAMLSTTLYNMTGKTGYLILAIFYSMRVLFKLYYLYNITKKGETPYDL